MQRLKTRPQFQATMAGETVARTAHFALHRLVLGARECAPASERPGAQAHPKAGGWSRFDPVVAWRLR